jgi:hypothetical protein
VCVGLVSQFFKAHALATKEYAAYSCEMPESLFATFTSIDTFSQHLYSEIAAKFPAVLEAVSDCLCRAVNSNRNAINSYILDSLCQCLAGESHEAQFQTTGHGLFCFKVDCHPNRGGANWEKTVEPDCGLQANDAIGYALTREHYLALKVRGKILAGVKPTPNLQKESAPESPA